MIGQSSGARRLKILTMLEASKSNIHGYIHGICEKHPATLEVLKNLM